MKLKLLFPGLPLSLRLVIFYIIEAAGLFIQLYVERFFPGLLVMIAGLFLVFAKNYTNKPVDTGLEDWLPVSFDEFKRIETNLKAVKTRKYPRLYKARFGCLVSVILAVVLLIAAFLTGDILFFFVLLDILIVTFPLFYTGTFVLWTPPGLKIKMEGFRAILDKAGDSSKEIIITPYIRFDKDEEGKRIPEDIRFMVELRRNPSDLLGAQFQTAINKGPNGQVPYMYAVFICQGKGPSYEKLKNLNFGRFLKEAAGKEDYSTVVVRQKTESGGYFTKNEDCLELFQVITEGLRSIGKAD